MTGDARKISTPLGSCLLDSFKTPFARFKSQLTPLAARGRYSVRSGLTGCLRGVQDSCQLLTSCN